MNRGSSRHVSARKSTDVAPRVHVATKAARKSAPSAGHANWRTHEDDTEDTVATPRMQLATKAARKSSAAAPRKQLAFKAARKGAPSAGHSANDNSEDDAEDDGLPRKGLSMKKMGVAWNALRKHPEKNPEESGAASSSADPNAAAHGCYTQLHPKVQVAEGKGVNDCKDPKTAAEWAVLEKKQAKFVDTLAALHKAAKAEQDRVATMKAAAVHREKPLAQRIGEPVVGELDEAVDEFIASIDKPDDYECQDCASECQKCNGECCEGDEYGYGRYGRYNRYDPYDDYGGGCDCPCTCDDAAEDCECNGYRNEPAYQDLTDVARIAKEQLKLVPAGNPPSPWEESLTRGVALVDALTSMLRQVAERVQEGDGVTWPTAAGRKTLNGIIHDVQLVACRAIIQTPPDVLEGGNPFNGIVTAVAGWDEAISEIVDSDFANKWFTPPMPQKLAAIAAMLRNPTAAAASGDEPLVAIEARFDQLFSEKNITGALHLLTESKHAEAPVFQLRTIKALVGLKRYSDVISKPFHTFPTDGPSDLIEAAKLCDDWLQSSEQKLTQPKAFEATKCALMLISTAFQHMGLPTQGTNPLVTTSVAVLDRVIKRPENCSGSEVISSGTVDALQALVPGDNLSKAAALVLHKTQIGAALPELLAKIANYKTSGAVTASKTLARNLFKVYSGSLNDKAQLQIAGADDAVPEDAYEDLLADTKKATGSSGHLPGQSCELLLALAKAFEEKNDLWMATRLTAEAVLCSEFTKTPPILPAAGAHYNGSQQLKLKWSERGRLQASTIRQLLSKAVAVTADPNEMPPPSQSLAAGDGGSDVTPAPLLQGTNLKHVLDRLLAATCAGTLWLQALAEFTDFGTRGDQPLLPTATVHKVLLAAEKAYNADLAKDESLRTGSLVNPTADHLTVALLKEVDRCLVLKDASPEVKTLVLAAFRLDLGAGPVTSVQKQANAHYRHQPMPRTDFNIDRFLPKYEGLVDKAVLFKEMPPEFVRLLPLTKCIAIAAQAEPETALTFIGKANSRLWGSSVWVSHYDDQLGPVVQDLSKLLLNLHGSHVTKVDVLFFLIIEMVTPANVSKTRRKQMLGLLIEASASSDNLFDRLASWIPTLKSDALGTIAETKVAKLEFLSTAQTHPRRSAQVHILVQNMFKADPWNEQLQMIAFKGAAGMSNGETGIKMTMDLIDTMFPATGVGLWTIDAPAFQAKSSRYGYADPSHLEATAKLSSAHIKKVMEESATRARKVLELIPVVKRHPSCSKKLLARVEGGPVWDDVKRRAIEAWRKVVPLSFVCSMGHQQDRTMRKCASCLRVVSKLEQLAVFLLLASDALGETAAGNTVVKSLGAELTRSFKSRMPSRAITDMVGVGTNLWRQAHKVPLVVVPTFRGFPMPVYQVDKRITPVGTTEPATPIKAMPQEGAALIGWLQSVVPTMLKKAVLSFVNDQCATADVLLSMTLKELVEELSIQAADVTNALTLFAKMRVAGMGPREMITAEQVSAWIMHSVTDSSTLAQQIVDAGIDSTVLAACDDEALATAFGDRSAVSVLEQRVLDRLIALRNSLRHQNENHICPPMRSQDDAVNVLVIGGTGAGKSTLFNSLIHELQIVPTNCMRACTATIIELAFLTATVAGEVYVGEVEFITANEWVAELELLVNLAKSSQKDKAQQAALLKLKTVFGSDFDASSSKSVAELAADPACGDVGKAIRFGAATSADFAKRLRPYVDSADEADKGARWPLVKRVLLRGPWNACFGQLAYINLLDAPGLHDSNAERAATLAKVLHSADSILLVANSRRAVNDKTTQDAMPLTLRKSLVESGRFGQLALISTQTDLITTSEAIDNLKLPEDSTKLTCALKRNDFTRERAHMAFYEGIDPEILPVNRASGDFEPSAVLPAPWEAHVTDATNKGGGETGRFFYHNPDTDQTSWECPKQNYFQFPVFTVSSVEYQQHTGINVGFGRTDQLFPDAGATGVPALQQYLRDTANALSEAPSKRVGELMAEALNMSAPPDATAPAGVAAAPDAASSTVSTSGKRKQSSQGAATSAKKQCTENVSGSPFSGVSKPALKRQRKNPQNEPAAGGAPAADDESGDIHEVAAWSNTKVVGDVIDLTLSDSD